MSSMIFLGPYGQQHVVRKIEAVFEDSLSLIVHMVQALATKPTLPDGSSPSTTSPTAGAVWGQCDTCERILQCQSVQCSACTLSIV